ncbi:MAG: excinuclease ABC subunit UvrC [Pseudomonadota bacterium]
MSDNPIERGAKIIKAFAAKLPETPGVYRMINEKGDILYVGKAKALKRRVMSYTNINRHPERLKRMVAETAKMEVVNTQTEVEALLLESNLIKKLKPRYNILLRDDKSFPYILITDGHDFPRIIKHRGARKIKGEYFGPFASAGAVNRTIAAMQRAFLLRNCTDSYFAQRSRPCLQYHIKRCTAPCVDKVNIEDYAGQVEEARAFLSGQSREVQDKMAAKMQEASAAQDYEGAAKYRDRIKAMTAIQARQDINVSGLKDADVIGLVRKEGKSCVQVFFFRGGQNFGNRAYYPRHQVEEDDAAILGAFLAQFYETKPVPGDVIISHIPEGKELLEEALGQRANRKVKISKPVRAKRKRLIDFVIKNAEGALERHLLERSSEAKFLEGVAELFDMDEPPKRIEVYDNSHISGTNMVGGMIVAGAEGFNKNAYRKFNIKTADEGDDYGMMREVLTRRFTRALKEDVDKDGEDWPNLLLIDGGKGQFGVVRDVLEELGVLDDVTLVAIAKGVDRNAGREQFFVEGKKPFQLPINDPILHYLQRLRDEAHRFAIGAHRTRRKNDQVKSPLDGISGIGAKRKRSLLLHFGSGKEVMNASVEDLHNVDGISKELAQKIYDYFHEK